MTNKPTTTTDLTKEQILASMKACLDGRCNECSLMNSLSFTSEKCMTELIAHALTLIKKDTQLQKLEEENKKLKAEIEKLKGEVAKEFTCFVGDPHKVKHCPYLEEFKTVKAETIKEVTEKIKEEIHEALNNNYKTRQERIAHYENKGVQSIYDDFVQYCNGKIDALRGLDDYINSLSENL